MRKIFTAVSSALEFNSATLSGAIDVIVIQDDNGSRLCSPFYVRFGKLQLLKSRGTPVDVVLNDVKTDLRMYLGAAGEAYFYDESLADKLQTTNGDFPFSGDQSANIDVPQSDEPNVEENDVTEDDVAEFPVRNDSAPVYSPVSPSTLPEEIAEHSLEPEPKSPTNHSTVSLENSPSDEDDSFHTRAIRSTSDLGFQSFAYMSDSEMELTRAERDGTVEVVDEPRSPPVGDMQRRWSSQWARSRSMLRARSMPVADRPVDVPRAFLPRSIPHDPSEDQLSSLFGLPDATVIPETHSDSAEGPVDERSRSVRFLNGDGDGTVISTSVNDTQVEREEESKLDVRSVDGCEEREDLLGSEIEEKLAKALDEADKVEESEGVIEMSLCNKLVQSGMSDSETRAIFNDNRVHRADFESDPSILYDDDLLFRIENRLVNFKIAAPFVMAMLAYRTPMDLDILSKRIRQDPTKKPEAVSPTPSRRFGSWFGWASPRTVGEPLLNQDELDAIDSLDKADVVQPEGELTGQKLEEKSAESEIRAVGSVVDEFNSLSAEVAERTLGIVDSVAMEAVAEGDSIQPLDSVADSFPSLGPEEVAASDITHRAIFAEADYDSECFSFLPNAEQLQNLDLKPGPNEIRFVISSRSACELRCRVFLWGSDSKIVISDVDGTITRSDVLGHLLPGVGLDWSQVGVAGLYSQISKNGYKMLYLTARPIGQASQTRDFLHSVTQGNAKLPNGPVLMSPNRLVESFTREVIRRKPHEFKIGCLRDVRCLFPVDYSPFHAGFGNRDTDVISYRAVGLIPQRIFVVNPAGQLVVMKAMFESAASYSSLSSLVESVFPDITVSVGSEQRIRHVTETADWKYWRPSLPEVDLDALLGGP